MSSGLDSIQLKSYFLILLKPTPKYGFQKNNQNQQLFILTPKKDTRYFKSKKHLINWQVN